MPHLCFVSFVVMLFLGPYTAGGAQPPAPSVVMTNNNTRVSGTHIGKTVTVRLIAGRGLWRPEEADGPALDVAAFGEEGGPLLTPGPLVRVAEGTDVVVIVRNTLAEHLDLHGLVNHPANDDTVLSVPAGETREIRFPAGVPGTYAYWATTARATLSNRRAFESQLGGALIVDPRDNVQPDRVFVMTHWDDTPPGTLLASGGVRRVLAINGFSWPHTERLDARVDQPVHWRIVNLTDVSHAMHLHGFYFTVEAVGSALRETRYQPADYRKVVTERMPVDSTMRMTWTPERAGNWLFHCHILGHVTPALRFWQPLDATHGEPGAHMVHDAATGMAGLVMGVHVTGEPSAARAEPATTTIPHRITLAMRTLPGYWHPEDAFGFSLESDNRELPPAGVTVPGPTLVLHRDEPVEIIVRNELPEATAIHWHGIELESYFDGVPGWSGSSVSTTPAIDPGESFQVRFTPSRAGTFAYHTHSHDLRQLASGLYGAIVVLGPGERFDPDRDHVVLLGSEGPKDTRRGILDRFPVVVNGSRTTRLTLKAGVPNRLRLINITTNWDGLNVSLVGGNQALTWRAAAKDGADLPTTGQTVRPALRQPVSVGETYDFIVESPQSVPTWIEVRRGSGEWVQQVPVRVVP